MRIAVGMDMIARFIPSPADHPPHHSEHNRTGKRQVVLKEEGCNQQARDEAHPPTEVINNNRSTVGSGLQYMHNCTCCDTCRQDLIRLRAQYQSLLLDYPPLKEKARLARQTLQIYKDENVLLHKTRIELAARITHLEAQIAQKSGERPEENAEGRRNGRKVDEMARVVACKNSEIASLKQEVSWRNYELSTLRKRIEELDVANSALKNQTIIHEGKDTTITFDPQKNNYSLNTTLTSKGAKNGHVNVKNPLPTLEPLPCNCNNNPQSIDKTSNYRLNLIQSKINQLQFENSRLRQHLITQI